MILAYFIKIVICMFGIFELYYMDDINILASLVIDPRLREDDINILASLVIYITLNNNSHSSCVVHNWLNSVYSLFCHANRRDMSF